MIDNFQRSRMKVGYKKVTCYILVNVTFGLLFSPEIKAQNETEQLVQGFFVAGSVFPQGNNELQVSFVNDLNKSADTYGNEFSTSLAYGISDRLQIGFELPYVSDGQNTEGSSLQFGNIEIELFYAFLRKHVPFALSGGVFVGLPNRIKNGTSNKENAKVGAFIVLSKRIGESRIHSDIGLAVSNETEIFYNIALVYPMWNWRGTIELNEIFADENSLQLMPGIFRVLPAEFEFGIGFPVFLSNSDVDYGIIASLVWGFELVK